MPLTDKEAAALARLEAERVRRISEKIEKGEAVRMPVLFVGARESIKAVRARTLAAMRAAGEKREIVSCDEPIITGVPRAGREPADYSPPISSEPPAPSIFDRRSAPGAPSFAVSEPQPMARSEVVTNMSTSFHRIWTQTEQPSDSNPGGAIAEGQYRIVNGNLEVTDLQGRLLGTQPINPGDDAEAAARAVLRKKRSSGFYAPIPYPRRSVH
jgi:hypothetical protein